MEEEDTQEEEDKEQTRPHKGGRILRLEPNSINELMASPMVASCFQYVGCLDFCKLIERVQHHPVLTTLFSSHLKDNQVTLAGVTFTLSTFINVAATGIPNMGEKWFKSKDLEDQYYEPFIKPLYRNERRKEFPFTYLLNRLDENHHEVLLL